MSIRKLVGRHDCKVQTLELEAADVDDDECRALVNALETNNSVTSLNLSHNLIGASEMKNVVQPDLVTGGESDARRAVFVF